MRSLTAIAMFSACMISACSAEPIKPSTTKVASASIENVQQIDLNKQNFSQFFNEFKRALEQKHFDILQAYIQFPLGVRGELDNSPTLQITKDNFTEFFTEFLAEPVYLEQNGELVGYALSTLAATANTPTVRVTNQASWQGMTFKPIKGKWALVEITTYDHLIELHQ